MSHPAAIPTPEEAAALRADNSGNPVIERAVTALECFGDLDAPMAARLLPLWRHFTELSDQDVRAVLAFFVGPGHPPVTAVLEELVDVALDAALSNALGTALGAALDNARQLLPDQDDDVVAMAVNLFARPDQLRARAEPVLVAERCPGCGETFHPHKPGTGELCRTCQYRGGGR